MDLFTNIDGASIPLSPKDCYIVPCSFKDISFIFRDFHYKSSHMGGGIDICIALKYHTSIMGGAVIGKLRQDKSYSSKDKRCVEIRRMALIDKMPHNSESWFLGKVLRLLKTHTNYTHVISYSDKSQGHIGTIYKASNFKLIGETSATVRIEWKGKLYHPRSLTIDRPYSKLLNKALSDGTAVKTMGLPKLIFEYQLKERGRE